MQFYAIDNFRQSIAELKTTIENKLNKTYEQKLKME